MRRKIEISARAQRQVRIARKWWLANREKAPQAFDDDFEAVVEQISANPRIGRLFPTRRSGALRRILVERARFYLYYRLSPDEGTVYLVAFWSARRPTPKL